MNYSQQVFMNLQDMKSVSWLYISVFIDLFGSGLLMPMLGSHLRSIGMSPSIIGLLGSTYLSVQLLSGPVVGSWSDNFGRKRTLTVSLVICSFAYFALGCARTFISVLSLRIVIGLLKHTQALCKAVVGDVVSIEIQTETYGKLNAIGSMTYMFTPVLAGYLAELENSFQYACIITSLLLLTNSLLIHLSFPEKKKNNVTLKSSLKGTVQNLTSLNWKQFWDIFLLKFIIQLSLSVFFSNYYIFVKNRYKVTPKYIGYTVAFQGLISTSSGLQTELFNKLYSKNTSYFTKRCHCLLILSMSYLCISLSTNFIVFILCLLPLCVSYALLMNYSTNITLERTSSKNRGSLIGAVDSVSKSARLVAPLLRGLILEYFDVSSIVVFAFILSCLSTCLSAFLNMYNKPNKKID